MVRSVLVAALAASASALNVARKESQDLFTIELAPGVTKQVTEAEKWALKAVSDRPNRIPPKYRKEILTTT